MREGTKGAELQYPMRYLFFSSKSKTVLDLGSSAIGYYASRESGRKHLFQWLCDDRQTGMLTRFRQFYLPESMFHPPPTISCW